MKAKPNTKNRVCARWRDEAMTGRPSIGLAGQDGWHDNWHTWMTNSAVCEQCGEMLGTSRPRYGANRWPATVERRTCNDCDASICEKCGSMWHTNEVIGTGYRRTEGGARVPRNEYRYVLVCPACSAIRKNNAKPKDDAGAKLLKELGLW